MSPRQPAPTPDLRPGDAPDDDRPPQFARLLADDAADPRLAAAARELRRGLIEQYGADSPANRALVKGAVAAYYLQQVLAGWTAAFAEAVEREIFDSVDGSRANLPMTRFTRLSMETGLQRVAEQMALQERAARLLARNLATLRDRQPRGKQG